MDMHWFVLQVMTGREITVRNALQRERIPAKVPRSSFSVRRGGRWHLNEKVLFPGYVFVGCESFTASLYYECTSVTGVLRFLGGQKAQPITYGEAEQLALLAPDNDPLLPSTIRIEGESFYIASGVLQQFGNEIIAVERRRRRAKVQVRFLGETKTLTLPLVPESEAATKSE